MHTYQITDSQGTDMQLQARDAEDAQERFIDICEAKGVQHGVIVRIVRL